MYFEHVPEIWQQFPHLAAGLLVIEGVTPDPDVEARLPAYFERARGRLADGTEGQLAEVIAWRRAFAEMGFKPTKYRSAAEALLRRFRREDEIPRLHPLVDLCNAISLAYALPVAIFDLNQVDRFIEVRHAVGSEQYLDFNGETENPVPGEVIFADGRDQVHARRWTFRQSLRSIVRPETERVLIVSEALHDEGNRDIGALIGELATEIEAGWGPPAHRQLLSAAQPRLSW